MSTELATTNQGINLFDPAQFETLQRVCNVFINSELVPKMYRVSQDNPKEKAIANSMIAVNMAQRLGADPLMVMQNMYIVHGQPAWSAKFLAATVNTCGRYNTIRYDKKVIGKVKFGNIELDNIQCIAYTTEKGSEEILESAPVSIEMAIKEGWYGKTGSKWQTMPELMLQYRAVTFWTRAYAPELSMGMKTDDEIRDIVDVDYEDVTVSKKVENEILQEANKQTISMDNVSEKNPEQKPVDRSADPKTVDKPADTKNDNAGSQSTNQPQMKF